MTSKLDNANNIKIGGLLGEAVKIEEKLHDYRKVTELAFGSAEAQLDYLRELLNGADTLTDTMNTEIAHCVANVKSKISEQLKAHRDVHPAVSKFGKYIDKNFTEDVSHLTSYFIDRSHVSSKTSTTQSPFAKDKTYKRSQDELLRLVIIEHLLRQGLDGLASDLVHDFGFDANEVGLDKFRDLSNLVSTVQRGNLEHARKWLSDHKEQLGGGALQLEYELAKLDFLTAMRNHPHDPAAILHHARQLVPFARTYPDDFEHLMGSLVFLGRSLEDTPYADLALRPSSPEPMEISPSISQENLNRNDTEMAESQSGQLNATVLHSCFKPDGALVHAANLFRSAYCYMLNLSDLDPLCTVFNSGCRLLSKQQTLQRAISCFGKYSNMDADTLPIAVDLDPAAHRHNIFHCPVMKELTTTSNGPVRLSCGHAISRDAFESLPSGDRSKVKCPYCPVETYKNQALDLIF
ncbi:uncharacterized protein DEA37_0012730 [Paragonimus westermani]|uniref:RING-Gid-type domain-containing protein n=1 Tax=Paragonimus westermani TaxID=34504 RepID=A0A5J4NRI0_9TREM|nr:uncharacterized protein DEA37_0012730 [Paragonimus westermani]